MLRQLEKIGRRGQMITKKEKPKTGLSVPAHIAEKLRKVHLDPNPPPEQPAPASLSQRVLSRFFLAPNLIPVCLFYPLSACTPVVNVNLGEWETGSTGEPAEPSDDDQTPPSGNPGNSGDFSTPASSSTGGTTTTTGGTESGTGSTGSTSSTSSTSGDEDTTGVDCFDACVSPDWQARKEDCAAGCLPIETAGWVDEHRLCLQMCEQSVLLAAERFCELECEVCV
jgi:hypothetical protein